MATPAIHLVTGPESPPHNAEANRRRDGHSGRRAVPPGMLFVQSPETRTSSNPAYSASLSMRDSMQRSDAGGGSFAHPALRFVVRADRLPVLKEKAVLVTTHIRRP